MGAAAVRLEGMKCSHLDAKFGQRRKRRQAQEPAEMDHRDRRRQTSCRKPLGRRCDGRVRHSENQKRGSIAHAAALDLGQIAAGDELRGQALDDQGAMERSP